MRVSGVEKMQENYLLTKLNGSIIAHLPTENQVRQSIQDWAK